MWCKFVFLYFFISNAWNHDLFIQQLAIKQTGWNVGVQFKRRLI